LYHIGPSAKPAPRASTALVVDNGQGTTRIPPATFGGGQVASGRQQYLQALASLTEMTRTQAERVAARLAKQGELQSGQVSRAAEDLLRRTQKNRETVSRLVQREVKRQLGMLGIATRDEVARLQQRVRALEQELARVDAAKAAAASRSRTGSAGRGGSGARRRTPTQATAKTTAAKPTAAEGSALEADVTTRTAGASTGSSATGGRGTARRSAGPAQAPSQAKGAEPAAASEASGGGEAPSQS
jgi:polyhydroxyalkanoate synthesis regulator phasin